MDDMKQDKQPSQTGNEWRQMDREFNSVAEARETGLYMRRGRVYPAMIGQSHTARLASGKCF